jgi:hypothetical protein
MIPRWPATLRSRSAHAVELARDGVRLNVIQRQRRDHQHEQLARRTGACQSLRMRARVARAVERAVLGALMAVVAYLLERVLLRRTKP